MVRKSVAEILTNHVTFELEAIDRMYLNAYVPSLQTGAGFVYFLKTQLGVRVPSTVMIAPMSQRFVDAMERFAETEGVDLVAFEKGQRKDDVAQKYLAAFDGDDGVLFIGKAQEKASVFRTDKRRDAAGKTYPWISRATAMPNHYYVYIVDRDFGPRFIKFCSYFPYAAKLCLNGHEWLKRQLTRRGIAFEPLDNGIQSSNKAARVQRIADELDAAKIDAVFRKWLRRLPHPFAAAHRKAGYRYHLSILEAEFALTQVLDRPLTGRCFFEEVIHVESLSHDCLIGEDCLRTVTSPVLVHDQRAAGLRFGDTRVHALMHALCLFALAPTGFRHRELRDYVAQLRHRDPDGYSAGAMTYDLRRLRLHGLIERVPRSHRYGITPLGARVAMFYARLYTRALRPACSLQPMGAARAQRVFDRLDTALANFLEEVKLAA
jgi:hypothetical protein